MIQNNHDNDEGSNKEVEVVEEEEDWNFTEQELLAVLPSPDDDQEIDSSVQQGKPDERRQQQQEVDERQSSFSFLPDIPVSEQDWKNLQENQDKDDDEEEEQQEDWEHLFDDDNDEEQDNDGNDTTQLRSPSGLLTSTETTDTTTLELLAQLEELQLQDNNNNNNGIHWIDQLQQDEQDEALLLSSSSPFDPPPIFLPNGDIQPWLYCQPCEVTTGNTYNRNDDSETKSFLEPWELSSQSPGRIVQSDNGTGIDTDTGTDIDHLLAQLAIYQPLDDDDKQDNNNRNHIQTSHEPPAATVQEIVDANNMTSSTANTSPAMQTLLQSFGIINNGDGNCTTATSAPAKTTAAAASSPPNRKLCLGHRERIMGVAMSTNGLYTATAGSDSTVRIWRNQRLLATLRGHDTEHECLRVAWATERWINAATTSTATKTPLTPAHDSTVKSSVPTSVREEAPPTVLETYWLATAGADGVVFLWTATTSPDQPDPTAWQICATLDHTTWITDKGEQTEKQEEEPEKPQIYALSLIDDWHGLPNNPENEGNAFVLTSSEDHVHLWEWQADAANKKAKIDDGWSIEKKNLREVFSVHFGSWQDVGYGVTVGQVTGSALLDVPLTKDAVLRSAHGKTDLSDDNVFGGTQRNPRGIVYVFDAAYSTALGCLGVALSDGTVRLLNGRGVCWSVLQLPHVQAHLTALSWSPTTNILATAVATGEVVTWQVWPGHTPICRAILAGGHEPGRPLFGVGFYGTAPPPDPNDPQHACQNPPPPEALLSWGIDGRLCVWEPTSEGNVEEPVATLVDDADYPLFAVAMCKDKLVAAGGGSDGGLIGIPVHLYTLREPVPSSMADTSAASSSGLRQAIPEVKETDTEKEDSTTLSATGSDETKPPKTKSEASSTTSEAK